ncbi:MAG: DsbA family protein [Solirubrobacteraceae bacterium]
MGELISLTEHRAARLRRAADVKPATEAKPTFFVDLACPFSYLAADRVERALGEVEWVPTAPLASSTPHERSKSQGLERATRSAEARAAELRLPLVWPERYPSRFPSAMRVAAFAAGLGLEARFMLAAGRLAFCGGFDLEDPEILAEAAAAAGLGPDECLDAARDAERDEALELTAGRLAARGVTQLPAIRLGTRFFQGERGVTEASGLMRTLSLYGAPLAPAG